MKQGGPASGRVHRPPLPHHHGQRDAFKGEGEEMRPPFIRHNHPQAALISQEARQTESILAPLHEGRMNNVCVCVHASNTILDVTQRAGVS